MSRILAAAAGTALWALAGLQGPLAQPAGGEGGFVRPPAPVQGYVAPRIRPADLETLARQPDLQGKWTFTSSNPQAMSTLTDPDNVHVPYELPPGTPEFGARPGTYLTRIPYKPEYRKQYMDTVAEAEAGRVIDTYAQCIPFGMPRFMAGAAVGFDLLQHADLIIMQNAYDNETRRIFMDGRGHPGSTGPEGTDARTYTGHSVGHWEGDTLVVHTVNMLPGFYDMTSARHSGEVRLTERLRMVAPDALENRMTVEDPVMFTGPWEFTRIYRRVPVRAGEIQPGYFASTDTKTYRFHELQDRPCIPIDMSKGYQDVVLPQELEQQGEPEKTLPRR